MMKRVGRSDRGATLVIVLIIVTCVSTVLAAILSQADTNVRTTIALRDQASANYAGDAAAQAVIADLRSQLNSGASVDCSDPASPTVTHLGDASGFYVPDSSEKGPINATIQCAPDNVEGKTTTTTTVGTGVTIDEHNTLGYAVLSVGSNSGQKYGNVCIAGGNIVSNSTINVSDVLKAGTATSDTDCVLRTDSSISVTAAGATGCNGSANNSNASYFNPTPCTHASAPVPSSTWTTLVPQPLDGYNTSTDVNPAPLCYTYNSVKYAAFRPGKYTTVPGSSGSCANPGFAWFTPGTYYFDYGTTTWSWPNYLVGGTPQDASGNVIQSLVGFNVKDTSAANAAKLAALATVTRFPGSCADPALQLTYPGVEFVFGGSSKFQPSQNTQYVSQTGQTAGTNEICATYSTTSAPVAIYGVSRDVVGGGTLALNGGGSISSETLCASPPANGCTSASADSTGQSLIVFDTNGHNTFFVHGYLYAPSAPVSFWIKNSNGVLVGWGIVVRSLDITTNGASPVEPYIAYRPTFHQGQTTTTVDSYTVRYLNVWTCPASATACAQTGEPNLRVKVKAIDNGDGTYKLAVLSWNHRR